MTTYSLDFINSFINNNLDVKNSINPDVLAIIAEITTVVSSPSYNKFPDFANKKIYKNLEYIKRKDAKKNELEKSLDILRNLFNKLTDKTYIKLSGEIDINIEKIVNLLDSKDSNTLNQYESVNNIIFSTFFISKFNSKLYCQLYIDKLQKYSFIERQLFKYVETDLPILYEKIEICNTVKFDEIDRINKSNDRVKARLIFYCNCAKYDIINIMCISETVFAYFQYLNTNIEIPNNKPYCEEIVELICLALTNIHDNKGEIDEDDSIYHEIQKIINIDTIPSISVSNKMILKFKNLCDNVFPHKKSSIENEDDNYDDNDDDDNDDYDVNKDEIADD